MIRFRAMADGPGARAPDRSGGTMRVSTVGKNRSLSKTVGLVLVVAVGGAALGSLGSHLLARFALRKDQSERKAPVLLLRANSLPQSLAEIDRALGEQDSAVALVLCEEALRLYPGEPQLLSRRKRSAEVQLDRYRAEMLEQALERRNFVAAVALYDQMSVDSPVRLQVGQKIQVALPLLQQEVRRQVERATRWALCDEIHHLGDDKTYCGGR